MNEKGRHRAARAAQKPTADLPDFFSGVTSGMLTTLLWMHLTFCKEEEGLTFKASSFDD